MPTPVIAQTFLPSVTGEGEDIFCLRILTSPSLRCFFHNTVPLFRSNAHKERLLVSETFRKMVSPQMIGVEPLQATIGSFQVTLSSVDHLTGRFFSLLTPLRFGPRHCGQLSAETTTNEVIQDRAVRDKASDNFRRMSFPP